MNIIELKKAVKPCPFCGSNNIYITFERGYIDDSAVVFCNDCKVSVKAKENVGEGFDNNTAKAAVEAWNRRAEGSDLISRQTAIDVMLMAIDDDWESDYAEARMREVPSAEPERKKGKWLCDSYCIAFKHKIWQCSVCGNLLDFAGVNAGRGDANYCPNCGARMDGE